MLKILEDRSSTDDKLKALQAQYKVGAQVLIFFDQEFASTESKDLGESLKEALRQAGEVYNEAQECAADLAALDPRRGMSAILRGARSLTGGFSGRAAQCKANIEHEIDRLDIVKKHIPQNPGMLRSPLMKPEEPSLMVEPPAKGGPPDGRAHLKAQEEARKKGEEDARLKAAEEARKKAEEEARAKAAEESREKAEPEAFLTLAVAPAGPRARGILQCVHSSTMDVRSLAPHLLKIDLMPDETVTIGRQHQVGFFETLLPYPERLACISRSHIAARLQGDRQKVFIQNLSVNAIIVDGQTLQKQQHCELEMNGSLKFMALFGRLLLEFRLI